MKKLMDSIDEWRQQHDKDATYTIQYSPTVMVIRLESKKI